MNKTKWWLRIVGTFYLLLTTMNIYALFLGGNAMISDGLPPPLNADPLAARAFEDAWLVFVFEFGVLGATAVYASRHPSHSRMLIIALIGAELFRGILADIIWIMRGYEASGYIGFIVVHAIIALTGVMVLKQEKA